MEFVKFPKIPRLNRECIVTEKIDGTNAQIWISEDLSEVRAGSRNRWITPESDNQGFARWVAEHADELKELGPGHHFGEWWGQGIQRKYGLDTKRFSLFNVSKWGEDRPLCCEVVPVLGTGMNMYWVAEVALCRLKAEGSLAAPGFMQPEGVVVFHTASGYLYKVTIDGDDGHKGSAVGG